MVVGIDGRSLRGGPRARGVARYLALTLEALASCRDAAPLALRLLSFGPPDRRLPKEVEVIAARAPSQLLFGLAALSGRPQLDRLLGRPDVVWLPAVAPVALDRKARLVLTVHDLSFELAPRDYNAYERLWHRLARPARLARRARTVIVPSQRTRQLLLERWRLPTERVRVIRPGPGRSPRTRRVPPPPGLEPRGYVLAVGALEPRKRPDLLVTAFQAARKRGLRARLVFAGDGPLRARLGGEGVVLLGRVDDDQLDALYAHALCLACPSRDEGFGFTPLEAASFGTPAVVSDLEVFRETLDGAALRFTPGDPQALADCLLELERNEPLRRELGARAALAASALSWERSARELANVLREAAS